MEFDIPEAVHTIGIDGSGVLTRGVEVLSLDQDDNPTLDLDQVSLPAESKLARCASQGGRNRYLGEVVSNGQPAPAIFTPYADCGGEGSRFRTAFPLRREIES